MAIRCDLIFIAGNEIDEVINCEQKYQSLIDNINLTNEVVRPSDLTLDRQNKEF
jgi:hypothetical protein